MLVGAIVGLVVGLVIGVVRAVLSKGEPCASCGTTLPVPWFQSLSVCPSCGAPVGTRANPNPKRPLPRRSAAVLLGLSLLALVGLGGAVAVLPAALESRRVWLHQAALLDNTRREIATLAGRQDPSSRRRFGELQELERSLYPETFREEFQRRLLLVGLGVGCFAIFALLACRVWLRRRGRDEVVGAATRKRKRS